MYKAVLIFCLVMALASAVFYILLGVGVMHAGNLAGEDIPTFYYVIPVGYALMGAALFFRKRWIIITDLVLVVFTLLVFYSRYATQPDVMWSVPGLATKIAQLLMGIGLVYLLVNFKKNAKAK